MLFIRNHNKQSSIEFISVLRIMIDVGNRHIISTVDIYLIQRASECQHIFELFLFDNFFTLKIRVYVNLQYINNSL